MQVFTASPARLQTIPAEPRFDLVRILADDLTGACDSAAAFLASGQSVRVWLSPTGQHAADEPVQAFNTASRAMNPIEAATAVSLSANSCSRTSRTLWFKKVDSAGRGAIAAEVLATHRALGTRNVLFAPSFPAAGRTVLDGILHVQDSAGTNTQIPLISRFQKFGPTSQIANAEAAERAIAAGETLLICDASTQDELEALASIGAPSLLHAGSGGLAKALAKVHFQHRHSCASELPKAVRPVTVSGSRHSVTQLQMQHIAETLLQHKAIQIAGQVVDQPAILHNFEDHDPDALILTGGDTALLVLQTLGAQSILLRGEIADGIPWGLIQGGIADGRVVVTKSGGFGSPDSLTRIVQLLTGESSE